MTYSNLTGKTVGVVNGYTYGDKFESAQNFKKEVANSELANIEKLALGRVDYVVIFRNTFSYLMSKNPNLTGKIRQVGSLGKLKAYINFSKIHPDAKDAIAAYETGIQIILKNGKYSSIFSEWKKSLNNGK